MKKPLKTFKVNTAGRDFVVGDMHGSYSAFINLLNGIKFDNTVDRMFSVGDLIDRGPDSLRCLSLIREPWFHSVLANHEKMILDSFLGGPAGQYWYTNGGDWGMEYLNDYRAIPGGRIISDASADAISMIPLIQELPYLITVNTKSGKKFHIIHAELPSSIAITDSLLEDPVFVHRTASVPRGDGEAFLWSRNIFGGFFKINPEEKHKLVRTAAYRNAHTVFNDELSHIISGHTILTKPLTIVGQTNIDTGAYYSYWGKITSYGMESVAPRPWAGLTCVDLDAWQFYQATADKFNLVDPLAISQADIDGVSNTL